MVTDEATKMDFERVCVEVSLNSTFPHSFSVISEFGGSFDLKVEYGWIPKRCVACGVFEHSNYGCNNKGVK